MAIRGIGNPIDIAVSGMRAEGVRLRTISSNIANAHTTQTPDGEAFRRQEVVAKTDTDVLGGVTVEQIVADTSTQLQRVYMPGHPDAGTDGFVEMPNVDVPQEMMQMITASRAYQANAAVMKRYQDMMNVTTELLR